MAQNLQATLDTILDKVAILECRFDKLLTQSLTQLSETAHAHESEINVEVDEISLSKIHHLLRLV